MSEPIRVAYSRSEMLEKVRNYMLETYGVPKDLPPDLKTLWMERAGMLWDFVAGVYPSDNGGASQ